MAGGLVAQPHWVPWDVGVSGGVGPQKASGLAGGTGASGGWQAYRDNRGHQGLAGGVGASGLAGI